MSAASRPAATEKTVRLADVAKAAGVSQGTASNVFNRPGLVREEVREHVRAVAARLGYRGPDPKGRLLRAGKVNAIGVATTEKLSYFFDDPFARVVMTGITEVVDAAGAGVSLVSAASEEELAWNVGNALVDGLVLLCLEGGERLVELTRERQLPFVALALGHADLSISAVGVDDRAGIRDATQHLVDLGHRRFAILALEFDAARHTGRVDWTRVENAVYRGSRDRVLGTFDALAPAGIDTAAVPIFETQNDRPSLEAALEQLFATRPWPTAIVAQSDRLALAALDWFRARGIAVPGEVSIVGFDGVPEAATSSPPLTTVTQPIAEIGRIAARMILEGDGRPRQTVLPTELVVRGTTAPPPKS